MSRVRKELPTRKSVVNNNLAEENKKDNLTDWQKFVKFLQSIFKPKRHKPMKVSEKVKPHLLEEEGLKLMEYRSIEGGTNTIGIGHKLAEDEHYPDGITEAKAYELLDKDIKKFERIVNNRLNGLRVNQSTFDLLFDLAWNTGTVYNKVITMLKNGTFKSKYNKIAVTADGVFVKGLENRRNDALKRLA